MDEPLTIEELRIVQRFFEAQLRRCERELGEEGHPKTFYVLRKRIAEEVNSWITHVVGEIASWTE